MYTIVFLAFRQVFPLNEHGMLLSLKELNEIGRCEHIFVCCKRRTREI